MAICQRGVSIKPLTAFVVPLLSSQRAGQLKKANEAICLLHLPPYSLCSKCTHTHILTSRQTAMWKQNKPTVLYLSPAEMYWTGIQVLLGLNE